MNIDREKKLLAKIWQTTKNMCSRQNELLVQNASSSILMIWKFDVGQPRSISFGLESINYSEAFAVDIYLLC